MDGSEHYREAERLLGLAAEHPGPTSRAALSDLALVHAVLAVAYWLDRR